MTIALQGELITHPIPFVQAETIETPVVQTIEQKIRQQAKLNNLDEELLVKIATCESKLQNIPNFMYDGEDGIYTAYGPFQILKSTAKGYSDLDRREIDNNIEIAMMIFAKEGSRPWNESKECWFK